MATQDGIGFLAKEAGHGIASGQVDWRFGKGPLVERRLFQEGVRKAIRVYLERLRSVWLVGLVQTVATSRSCGLDPLWSSHPLQRNLGARGRVVEPHT